MVECMNCAFSFSPFFFLSPPPLYCMNHRLVESTFGEAKVFTQYRPRLISFLKTWLYLVDPRMHSTITISVCMLDSCVNLLRYTG